MKQQKRTFNQILNSLKKRSFRETDAPGAHGKRVSQKIARGAAAGSIRRKSSSAFITRA